jgi:hypothetical protein
MTRLLMVITGADRLTLNDGMIRRTGFWAEEVVVPHELFREVWVVRFGHARVRGGKWEVARSANG